MHGRDRSESTLAGRAERRLSEVVPVYAASDQDVCGVDMSLNNVQIVAA
jgi:hypothetical protein